MLPTPMMMVPKPIPQTPMHPQTRQQPQEPGNLVRISPDRSPLASPAAGGGGLPNLALGENADGWPMGHMPLFPILEGQQYPNQGNPAPHAVPQQTLSPAHQLGVAAVQGDPQPMGFPVSGSPKQSMIAELQTIASQESPTSATVVSGACTVPPVQNCAVCHRFCYFLNHSDAQDAIIGFSCQHVAHELCLRAMGESWVQRGRSWQNMANAAGCCPKCHPGCMTHGLVGRNACKPCSGWRVARRGGGGKCNALARGECEKHCHMQHEQDKAPRERKEKRTMKRDLQRVNEEVRQKDAQLLETQRQLQELGLITPTSAGSEVLPLLCVEDREEGYSDISEEIASPGAALEAPGPLPEFAAFPLGNFPAPGVLPAQDPAEEEPFSQGPPRMKRLREDSTTQVTLHGDDMISFAKQCGVATEAELNPHVRGTAQFEVYEELQRRSPISLQRAYGLGLTEIDMDHYLSRGWAVFNTRNLQRRTSSGDPDLDPEEHTLNRDVDLHIRYLGPSTIGRRCTGTEERPGCGSDARGAYEPKEDQANNAKEGPEENGYWCLSCWREHLRIQEHRDAIRKTKKGADRRRRLDQRLQDLKEHGGALEIPEVEILPCDKKLFFGLAEKHGLCLELREGKDGANRGVFRIEKSSVVKDDEASLESRSEALRAVSVLEEEFKGQVKVAELLAQLRARLATAPKSTPMEEEQ